MDVARDGRRFVVLTADRAKSSSITLLTNWKGDIETVSVSRTSRPPRLNAHYVRSRAECVVALSRRVLHGTPSPLRHEGKNQSRRTGLVMVDDVGCSQHVRSMRLILAGIVVSVESREIAARNFEA